MSPAPAFDIEILLPDGVTWLPFKLDVPDGTPEGADLILESQLSAASADSPLSQQLDAAIQEDWSGGIGVPGTGYNAAYCLNARSTPGYVTPAGAATGIQLVGSGLTHSTSSPLVAFAEYNNDFYIAQQGAASGNGGRVLKITGGTGTASESMTLSAGDYIRDLIVADNGSGTNVLFATSESATHTNARLHRFDGSSWTHTTAGTEFSSARGLGRMAYEFMTPDGTGDWRIVFITGPKTFAYTLPFADPMLGTASLTTDIRVGTSGQLLEIAAARRHFWIAATDGIFDIDELGNSSNLVSWMRQQIQTGNGYSVLYEGGYVYFSVGRGYVRVRVAEGAVLNEVPGQCAPGWNTPAQNDVRGYVTAACTDQGWIVVPVYNPDLKKTYICWGIDRTVVGVDTPNPMVWHGPEVVFDNDYKVNRVVTSGLAGDLRLWIASQSAGGTARLDWVSLPIAGSPLQDLVSGGQMKFATGAAGNICQPYCRLESLEDSRGDKASLKITNQYDIGTRGLSVLNGVDDGIGTKITVNARADAIPGQTTYTGLSDITTSPSQTLVPSAVPAGHKVQTRLDFFSPNGGASPPKIAVLDSMRTLEWRVGPSFPVRTIPIRYGDGVSAADKGSARDPDVITATLKTLTEANKVTLRLRNQEQYTVKFLQILDVHETLHDGSVWGKTVHAKLVASVLAGPL